MDLGERGGRTRMRKKNLRCKMFWGLACGVFLDALWPGKKNINIRKRKTYLGFLYNHL